MKDCSKILIRPDTIIRDAIKVIDTGAMKIALVVDDKQQLLGTVTDGDVRRGLLRGVDLQSTVSEIMYSTPLVAPPEMSSNIVLHLMKANRLLQLPVVDSERRVLGIHLWDEINAPTQIPNLMVIMAGGLGKRLLPHTQNCPKPMLPVAGKPMLEHIIERARKEGFSRFLIAVRYLGNIVEEYFGDGNRWDIDINYLYEDNPLGTAGALSLIKPEPELPVVVTNGDVLTDIFYGKLLEFHKRHQAAATMAVRLHEWQHPFGIVQMKGVEIVGFEEKPVHRTHVNAGVYVLEPLALRMLECGEACDMPTLFERLSSNGKKTVAFPMHEPWLDVGRPEDLDTARFEKGENLRQESE